MVAACTPPKATSMSTPRRSPEAAITPQHMGRREWLLLLLLAGLWSSSFLFFAVALTELPPLTVVLGRVGLAAPVLLLVLVATGHRLPTDWRHALCKPSWLICASLGGATSPRAGRFKAQIRATNSPTRRSGSASVASGT